MKLAATYRTLSARLRQAADYVVENPVDATTRSLRAVANDSGLPPATFSRMARAIGYDSFEDLREDMRCSLGRRVSSFSQRAERLRADHGDSVTAFLSAHMEACVGNIRGLGTGIDPDQLDATVESLHGARRVVLLGGLGSTGVVEHLSYVANFFTESWSMAGRGGASMGSALGGLGPEDAVILVTKPPFATRPIRAAELAREQGACVVVITDTHACPALPFASHSFIVQSESPHFFSSYTATLFLLETIAGLLAVRAGPEGQRRIAAVEERNRRLEEVRDG